MVDGEDRSKSVPSGRPMARLSDAERALIEHEPASLKLGWRFLRWLSGSELYAPLDVAGLSELIRYASACEVEYVIGEWLRQGATLTGVELQLLRAQPLACPPGGLLSPPSVASILAGWRLGAARLHEQGLQDRHSHIDW
ncbi:hypothetical protein KWH04_17785 [Xanthomonas campestris pv. trichodesmae]|uniref:Uncharacterized protein n=2 Tax=Xanthomonas citri TaxID=346 RepID=A0AB33CLR5_XANCI|nr:hypothetical protein [Xanthomonas citri]ASK94682.1 hypothetical protein XcvCFBP7111P_24690 [Xanthomonas citri pv. vignicola]MBV6782458.1 hypothetical protein [Xanthomonas campestris pv. trichodesmae]MBZ3922094.1 hypothetical protein [Xanthomonas campestris pv. trichodesmae]MBZ3926185.1 hypothetical protein [Xanthomonas citri pv. sesbaniae]